MARIAAATPALALLLLTATAGGCRGGGPAVPSIQLRQEFLPDGTGFDQVNLWSASSGAALLVIEHRRLPGAWTEAKRVDGGVLATFVLLHGEPELTDHEFRVRAFDARGASSVSAVVPFRRGVRPPAFGFSQVVDGGFLLGFRNWSLVADRFILTRRFVPAIGTPGPWTEVLIAVDQTSWVDTDLSGYSDGARVHYMLQAATANEASIAIASGTPLADPATPREVSAETIPGGIRISWENASAWANLISLMRYEPPGWTPGNGGPLHLPPPPPGGRGAFANQPVAPGVYRYVVEAGYIQDSVTAWWSPPVVVYGVSPLPASAGLQARLTTAPPGDFAAGSSAGGFVTTRPAYGWLQAGGDVYHLPGWFRFGRPGVVADPAGCAHAVFVDAVSGDTAAVVSAPFLHAWHDDLGWHEEEIARRTTYAGHVKAPDFAMGADGRLLAAWPGAGLTEVATRQAGGWALEEAPWVGSILAVAGDEAGQPHLLGSWNAMQSDPPVHAWRDATGWHTEPVPFGNPGLDLVTPAALCARTDRTVALLEVYSSVTRTQTMVLVERGPAGWGAPEPVGEGSAEIPSACSPDGARMLVVFPGPLATSQAWLHDGRGTTPLAWPYAGTGATAAGFDAAGKAWVLRWLEDRSTPGEPLPVAVFEEP